MKVVRDTNFKFRGLTTSSDGEKYLLFEDKRYPDYLVLVKRVKFIRVESNEVEHLDADSYFEGHQTPTSALL